MAGPAPRFGLAATLGWSRLPPGPSVTIDRSRLSIMLVCVVMCSALSFGVPAGTIVQIYPNCRACGCAGGAVGGLGAGRTPAATRSAGRRQEQAGRQDAPAAKCRAYVLNPVLHSWLVVVPTEDTRAHILKGSRDAGEYVQLHRDTTVSVLTTRPVLEVSRDGRNS